MKVYISNYSRYKGSHGVQISRSKPEWASVYKAIPQLFPTYDLIKSIKDTDSLSKDDPVRKKVEEEYVTEYTLQLNRNKENILRQLRDGDVLLCWCGVGKFCHRYIVQLWLQMCDIECEEC